MTEHHHRHRKLPWRAAPPALELLSAQIDPRRVLRARLQTLVLMVLFAGVIVIFDYRERIFGVRVGPRHPTDWPVRVVTAILLVALGFAIARDIGSALVPALSRRLDTGTSGTLDSVVRLLTLVVSVIVALNIAGVDPGTLAVGGAVSAVVLGLAAQQTFGNLFAGTVLLSARPFRVGDRIRLQGGMLAGQVEGVVASVGLLYTTLARDGEEMLIPNATVLQVAVMPIRQPEPVRLRARVSATTTPEDLERRLSETLDVPLLGRPTITLEELAGEEVVMRIEATPTSPDDGGQLASELIAAVSEASES